MTPELDHDHRDDSPACPHCAGPARWNTMFDYELDTLGLTFWTCIACGADFALDGRTYLSLCDIGVHPWQPARPVHTTHQAIPGAYCPTCAMYQSLLATPPAGHPDTLAALDPAAETVLAALDAATFGQESR